MKFKKVDSEKRMFLESLNLSEDIVEALMEDKDSIRTMNSWEDLFGENN